MNLDTIIQCKEATSPWLPNDACEKLEIWHAVDVPTAGTFDLWGQSFLFSVVDDVDDSITVWGYVPLATVPPDSFDSTPAMFSFIDRAFEDQETIVAAAHDFELIHWGRENGGTLLRSAGRFIKHWVAAMRSEASEAVQLEAYRAGAEVYAHNRELVPASH